MLFFRNPTQLHITLLTINDPSGTYLSEPSFNENRTSPSTNRHRYAELFKKDPSFRKKSILMGLSDETDSLSYKEISCGQPNPRQSDAGGGTGISFVCVSLCHTSDPYEDDGPAETDSGSGRNCGGRDQPVCIQCLAFGKGKRGADG